MTTDTSREAVERVIANLNEHDPQDMEIIAPTLRALLVEVERLREALEDVAGVGFDAPMTWTGTDSEWERKRANAMQHAARAALKGADDD